MTARYDSIFRRHCRATLPQPTTVAPRLIRLTDVRAVLFDVYGTLFISASGDVGTSAAASHAASLREALEAVGLRIAPGRELPDGVLQATIRRHHARARDDGIAYPEVDIVRVWRDVVEQLAADDVLHSEWEDGAESKDRDFQRLAVEYEARTNPTWPMPGMLETVDEIVHRGLPLGIVSNAQFFTPRLFPALAGRTLEALGFDANLRYYSYEHGWAKPGAYLYRRAAEELARRGIAATQTLYIGNDMLNDVAAAGNVGFRTALFAGDQRSLRLREGDPRVEGIVPDIVLADLHSLPACLG